MSPAFDGRSHYRWQRKRGHMSPPRHQNACGKQASQQSSPRGGQSKNTATPAEAQQRAADSLLWHVVVDGRTPGMPWGSFVTKAGALATVRRLHALGFAARVEGPTS